ncbi:LacI family DNA-binding transcriptional regulator [Pseudonocardia sp. CA-107938]|uniref:LacI family DNA-binding transcriptional regulator n=1 Tax=Pseudonocardia sp. CA-107938 TaxID=3240021 RepID=UPI003D8B78E2
MEPPRGVSLFAWVKQELLDSIARGEFTADQPFVTQREIVERFGVSTTTAVRALNELVAEGVVVRRRGRGTFVAPRPMPARAPSGVGRTIAYVSPDPGSGHESVLLAGLSGQCGELGLRVTIEHTRDVDHETQVLRALTSGAQPVDGVVFFPRERSLAAGVVEELRRAGLPVVLVDRYFPGTPTDAVLFDDEAVGHDVTVAMIERGHTGLAVLWSEVEVTSVRDRLAGHRRALREHGLAELPEWSALRTYSRLGPDARQERLLDWLRSETRPTALIGGNAPTVAMVVHDLLGLQTGFPGALEIASMDQSLPFDASSPLTAVAAGLPTRAMGQEAGRLVAARLDGDTSPPRHVVLAAELQVPDRGHNTLGVIGAATS